MQDWDDYEEDEAQQERNIEADPLALMARGFRLFLLFSHFKRFLIV